MTLTTLHCLPRTLLTLIDSHPANTEPADPDAVDSDPDFLTLMTFTKMTMTLLTLTQNNYLSFVLHGNQFSFLRLPAKQVSAFRITL